MNLMNTIKLFTLPFVILMLASSACSLPATPSAAVVEPVETQPTEAATNSEPALSEDEGFLVS